MVPCSHPTISGGLCVGIGEETSIFSIGALAVGEAEFTAEAVWAAVLRLAQKTTAELNGFPQPTMVLPKLVLLHTVMGHVSCRRVRYQHTHGTLTLLSRYSNPLQGTLISSRLR